MNYQLVMQEYQQVFECGQEYYTGYRLSSAGSFAKEDFL